MRVAGYLSLSARSWFGVFRTPPVWASIVLLAVMAGAACDSEEATPTPTGELAATGEAQDERAGWPDTVRLGLLPIEDDIVDNWEPVVRHLERELGLDVEVFLGSDYTDTIVGAATGELDVMWFGPKSYIEAHDRGADIEAVVKWINKDTGLAGYHSLLITRKNSGITTIEDAEGATFAFNEPQSTSGFLLPSIFFLEQGIDPEEYFSHVFFLGNHENTALAAANGTVDLASNNNETLPSLIEAGRIQEDNITIVWRSPLVPTDPVAVQNSLPQSFHAAVRDAFISFDDAATFEALQILGWTTAEDSDYDVIRTLEAMRAEAAAAR